MTMTAVNVYDENDLNLNKSMLFDDRKDAEEVFAALVRVHLKNKCSKSDIDEYIKKGHYGTLNSFCVRISDIL